jgi:glutathione S-transferase
MRLSFPAAFDLTPEGPLPLQQGHAQAVRLRGVRQLLQGAAPAGPARPRVRAHPDRHLRRREHDAGPSGAQPRRTHARARASGETLAESNAILLYLAEGTPLLPGDLLQRARVWQWLFFEQNFLEPNVGTARFWRLTGRDAERPEVFAARVESGRAALGTLERHLEGRRFLVGDTYTVADVSLFAYAHVAGDAGIDMEPFPAVRAWLENVRGTEGFMDDLDPYLPNARAGAGGGSMHG